MEGRYGDGDLGSQNASCGRAYPRRPLYSTEFPYLETNSGHYMRDKFHKATSSSALTCTNRRSTMGDNIFAESERSFTRAKLSTYTICGEEGVWKGERREGERREERKATQQTGTHVPGPLHRISSERKRAKGRKCERRQR